MENLNLEDGDQLLMVDMAKALEIRNVTMDLAIEANQKKKESTSEEMVPEYLHDY
jgi:hypothetical protein